MQKNSKKWKIEKIDLATFLCILVVACPILDVISFLFRNSFQMRFSPSTILRPVIPIIAMIYLFFKKDKKFKLSAILIGCLYGIYALIHLWLFEQVKTGSSYSNAMHEAQYLINYSFMILNLFLYSYVFRDEKEGKLRSSVLYSMILYLGLLLLAIVTGTSSTTYLEGIGYKGWFESGNSLSAILVLSLFVLLPMVKDKAKQKVVIPVLIVMGIVLMTVIGTRVGLLGYLLVCILYLVLESLFYFIHNQKINKKYIGIGCIAVLVIVIFLGAVGSSTLQRRKQLAEQANQIMDPSTNEVAHLTGDLVQIKKQIDEGTLPEGYMSTAQKQSVVELYEIAEKLNLSHTQMRVIQLIYNALLVKNQANPCYLLFGNGYMSQFRELVLEMEIPAFLFNFGIVGFILYFVPFLLLLLYGIVKGWKNRKQIDVSYVMLVLGCGFTFALSFFSGYTFFNSSSMIIIVTLNALTLCKIRQMEKGEQI